MTEAGDSTSRRLQVSWEQFHRDCRTLARHLRAFGPFRAMIAITRGGLVPAAIVARELSIRVIETISISSYAGEDRQEEARILKHLAPGFADNDGEGLLVVDDLVDTGRTARIMRALVPKAHLATVYAKPLGRPLVDTFVTEVSQDIWIDFPWDLDLAAGTSIPAEKS